MTNQISRNEKVEKAHALLAGAVGKLQSGEDWRQMLEKLARGGRLSLRRLSFGNQLLVAMQYPTATCVATYARWRREGRQVRKGEKALMILAPIVVKKESRKTGKPSDGGKPAEADGSDSGNVLVRFRVHLTFAGEQTDPIAGPEGRPLPGEVNLPQVTDDSERLEAQVQRLRDVALALEDGSIVSSFELRPRRSGDMRKAEGWYNRQTKAIVVVTGETSPGQIFATAVHELAHAIMHGTEDHHSQSYPEREVEAESVAFVVSSVLGLDTGVYSFPYVTGWARGDDAEKMVLRSGARIVKATNTILDALLGEESAEDELSRAA